MVKPEASTKADMGSGGLNLDAFRGISEALIVFFISNSYMSYS
jgi:hypothetical protein